MSPRNLFVVILKIFGVYLFITMINTAFATNYYLVPEIGLTYTGNLFGIIIFSLVQLALQYFLFYIFCFKSDFLINKLKLDNGFEEWNFSFFKKDDEANIDGFFIINLALWIAAFYIIITELPDIFRTLVNIRLVNNIEPLRDRDYQAWSKIVFAIVKIVLALLIIGYNKEIANYIDNRNSKTAQEENL